MKRSKLISNQYLVGVDIGGTKISVTLGTARKGVLKKIKFSTRLGKQPKRSIKEIEEAINELLSERKVKRGQLIGIGVGIPGPVDADKGMVEQSPHLRKWKGLRLKSILQRKFKVAVAIDNDANAAALGELYFGSGRGLSDFIYVTVSTGIGSGLIANGELVRGVRGAAGELGHTVVQAYGNQCKCGKSGCLEAYGSGTAIGNYVKKERRKGRNSPFFRGIPINRITGKLVSDAAKKGDRLAIEARHFAADYLGIGLANVINLLNPCCIILGGGVIEKVHHFWQPLMKAIKREAWPYHYSCCKIVRSKLGKRVTDLGLFALVLHEREIKVS